MGDKQWYLQISREQVRDYMFGELDWDAALNAQAIADDAAMRFDAEEDDGTPAEFVAVAKEAIALRFAPEVGERIALFASFLQRQYGQDAGYRALRLWVNYERDLAVFLNERRGEVALIARVGLRFKVVAERPFSEQEAVVDIAAFLAGMPELYEVPAANGEAMG